MPLSRDTSAAARRVQLEALRRLGPEARVWMAAEMSDDARAISEAGIRHRHRDWTDEQVRRALLDCLIGSKLAEKVLSTRPSGT